MILSKRNIVITGAARGLGKSFALSLASRGVNLALIDLEEEPLAKVAEECRRHQVTVEYYLADVSEEPGVINLFDQIVSRFQSIDALINNAGITRDGLLLKSTDQGLQTLSLKAWQTVIDVNLTGVFLCGREAARVMVEQQNPGVIVNISSISRSGNMGQSNYTASKAGVAGMTVTWAKELAKYGIRVCALAPGFVNTEMTAAIRPEMQQKILQQIPLRRMAEPEELSHAMIFLLENDYFTGRVLELDGGLRV